VLRRVEAERVANDLEPGRVLDKPFEQVF
jgi:hypothetical protein